VAGTDGQDAISSQPASSPPAASRGLLAPARLALIAAGLIAAGAVGYAVVQNKSGDSEPAARAANGAPPPSVDTVIANLEQRLAAKPNDPEGWRMLGWSYFETGRYAEAATATRQAIKLSPDSAELYSMLGEALVMAGDDPQIAPDARAAFARAVALDPKDPRARYFLAAAKDIDGKHQEALDDWFALLADTPADAPYAKDIREVIVNVGRERGIDVGKRLADARFAPPAAATGSAQADGGAAIAAAAIPGPSQDQMRAAAALPPGQQEAMVRQMVDGLAARLKQEPQDTKGWIMLMRSRMQLGETAKAATALNDARKALQTNPDAARQVREAAAALGVPGA